MKKAKYSLWAILSVIAALLFIVSIQFGISFVFPYGSRADLIVVEIVVFYLPLLAVILGIIAIIDIRKNKRKGLWLAVVGILIGLGWFLLLDVLRQVGTV